VDSLETKAIVQYAANSGVPHLRSSYYCKGHTPGGYHCQPGTGATGTAVDFQDPYPRDKAQILAIFNAFLKVEDQLAELIYSGAGFSIKDGVRVSRYSVSGHWNHVHVAVKKGTTIKWPVPAVAATPPPPAAALPARIKVGACRRPLGGYWLVQNDGGVFSYDGAPFYGSLGDRTLNAPIVGMAASPSGAGYWLVASDGGIFTFGDAGFYGSTGNIKLNKPIVAMAPTSTGDGYWLVASDGGVFCFGDAKFHGSTGAIVLNKPIVGITASVTDNGYRLVASDGGVFGFGDAAFHGSTGNIALNKPMRSLVAHGVGGYWLVAQDGGVFAFGDAPPLSPCMNLINGTGTVLSAHPNGRGGIDIYSDSGAVCSLPTI
jgi:hypothetical protein